MSNKPNREYKSTLFTSMLSEKKYALQVYNALNHSQYDNPDEITITTLENVVFINRYNDVSYLFNATLQLYEHQSTFNPNIPLRSFFYLANTYEKLVNENHSNLYGSKLIQIPTPKCVVFYNGEKEQPDRQVLKLSNSFANQSVEGDVEVNILMLNINAPHNQELLTECEVLYAYSLYNDKFREYNNSGTRTMTQAAIDALDYCLENNVMVDYFSRCRNEVVGMILEEYTTERVERDMKEMAELIEAQKQELEENAKEIASLKEQLSKLKS